MLKEDQKFAPINECCTQRSVWLLSPSLYISAPAPPTSLHLVSSDLHYIPQCQNATKTLHMLLTQ